MGHVRQVMSRFLSEQTIRWIQARAIFLLTLCTGMQIAFLLDGVKTGMGYTVSRCLMAGGALVLLITAEANRKGKY